MCYKVILNFYTEISCTNQISQNMKVFISWSGERSKAIAKALNDFLPKIIQALKPFYSPEIEKGATWSNKIDEALTGTSFGIICLTPDNLDSKWIHFESGALFKTPDARIWTFLTDLKNQDVPPPLSKFQHTQAEKVETLSLIKAINSRLKDVGGEPVREDILVEMFNAFWESFYKQIQDSRKLEAKLATNTEPIMVQREEDDILAEILDIVRGQQRQIKDLKIDISNLSSTTPRITTASLTRNASKDSVYYSGIRATIDVPDEDKQAFSELMYDIFHKFIFVSGESYVNVIENGIKATFLSELGLTENEISEIQLEVVKTFINNPTTFELIPD